MPSFPAAFRSGFLSFPALNNFQNNLCEIMTVYLNNTEHSFPDAVSIAGALDALGIDAGRGTAVAVNNTVIPRAGWQDYALQDNDRLTVIRATQGG